MKRSKFSLSHYKLLTCDMGELIPIGCFEVLPGDTVQQSSSLLVRVSPLLAPVMHPVRVRIHHWFVPYRIMWSDWESFITGGPDGLDASVAPYLQYSTTPVGGLLDYLGVPPGTYPAVDGLRVSAFPLRAYNRIWSEFYRDQDLQGELPGPVTGGEDVTSPSQIQKVAWEKDYFTSSRPWVTKGNAVTLPVGVAAPVVVTGDGRPTFEAGAGSVTLKAAASGPGVEMTPGTNILPDSPLSWIDPKLTADLTLATAVSINELREAFALQRYQEARARYGSRYTEYLRYLGVRSSDARLQRPEYLGGGRQTIQFSEVLQTGPDTADEGVATLKGHGIGAVRSNRYRRFFEEHGVVLSLMSVLPKTMYANSLHRMWSKRTKEDYWQKELEHIGQQEVLNKEVFAEHSIPEGVFGYQDRYDEYRRLESGIAGDFRSTLDFWHYARVFASEPVLNASFVSCDATKRPNAVQTEDVLWIMANHSIQARRMLQQTGRSFIF